MEKEKVSSEGTALRQRAEAQYNPNHTAEAVPMTEGDAQRLIYELKLHQIELEMVNEELIQTRDAVQAGLDRYTDLYDFAPTGYFSLDRNGKVLQVNLRGASLLGVERSRLSKRVLSLFISPADRPVFTSFLEQVFTSGSKAVCEVTLGGEDTTFLRRKFSGNQALKDPSQCVVRIEGLVVDDGQECRLVMEDISERKKIENTLLFLAQRGWEASGEAFFRALARYLAETLDMDYVCIDQLEGELQVAKTVAVFFDGNFEDNVVYTLKDTPCGDVVGKPVCIFPRDVRHLFPQDTVLQELGAESYLGTTLWSTSGQPIGLIAVIGRKPLTSTKLAESILELVAARAAGELERSQAEREKEHLQEQLHQAQKMESVGRLAGGVAHDFNNSLGVILGHTEMALASTPLEQPAYHDLQEILKATQYSAGLTRQLLAFARKQTAVPRVVDLNGNIENMLHMIRRLIGEDVKLVWEPAPEALYVHMDPIQIDQIMANLITNARDAIDNVTGTGKNVGTVKIKTSSIFCERTYVLTDPDFSAGEYTRLEISDNGSGMDHDTISHIFEPFYTTKEIGKGTGLGLAMVYGIVKQNNGFIQVSSEVDKGANFQIYLPRVDADVVPAPAALVVETQRGNGEVVLMVEDEESLLELCADFLEDQGYQVMAMHSPLEALRLVQARSGEINLLITDVVMPEMNGQVLAGNVRAIQPDLNCLFMSGYTADVIAQNGVLPDGTYFIQKPFLLSDLAGKVREALEKA
ncbi:MAG: ATP-binding protein [Chloroflexota bacterium]